MDKIRYFKEPELEQISIFDVNKNETILNENKINTSEQNNHPKVEQDGTVQNGTNE